MTRMRAISVSLILLVTLLCGLAVVIYMSGIIPDYRSDYRVTDCWFMSDGGTIFVVLSGNEDNQIMFGLRGSLDRPRSEFPSYVNRWHSSMHIPFNISPRSNRDRYLFSFLHQYLSDQLSKYEFSRVLSDDPDFFEDYDRNNEEDGLLCIVQVYNTLKLRNNSSDN